MIILTPIPCPFMATFATYVLREISDSRLRPPPLSFSSPFLKHKLSYNTHISVKPPTTTSKGLVTSNVSNSRMQAVCSRQTFSHLQTTRRSLSFLLRPSPESRCREPNFCHLCSTGHIIPPRVLNCVTHKAVEMHNDF